MKAIVCRKYVSPDVLRLEEIQKPTPKDNEVLVKVHAASANAADWHSLRADPFFLRLMGAGLLKPKNKILGIDIAGRIEAVDRNVKQLQPGDEVFGDIFPFGVNKAGRRKDNHAFPRDKVALKKEKAQKIRYFPSKQAKKQAFPN